MATKSYPRVQTCHVGTTKAVVISISVFVSVASLTGCAASRGGPTVAVFTPVHRTSASALVADAAVMRKRLQAIGNSSDKASVHGSSVVVTGTKLKVPAAALAQTGHFYIRPVLCGAPAYTPSDSHPGTEPGPLPTCGPDATTAANLDVNVDTGIPAHTIPPDPVFAPYPSTQDDNPQRVVLLADNPAAGAQQYPRFVLGRASPGATAIAKAEAVFDGADDQWNVAYTLTPAGSLAWDRVAQANFHQYLAIDLDGLVESAPLMQPTEYAYTSFEGKGEISASFTPVSARSLAAILTSGPLLAPLRLGGK